MSQAVTQQLRTSGVYANKPLDERATVATFEQLQTNFPGAYVGLHIYVEDRQTEYVVTKLDGTDIDMEHGLVTLEEFVNSNSNSVLYTEQTLNNSQKARARENIGAGTSNFSGSYNDLTEKPTIPDVSGKVDKIQGKGLSTNDYDNTEKEKVANAIQIPSATENNKIPVMRNGAIEWENKPLDGQNGAQGPKGADGKDAVNPFKGYYPSGVSKPATGAVGDYLYATPSDPQSTATATIWHYDANQTPPWTDTRIDVSAVVGVVFGSGQHVNAVKIKDENGEDDSNTQGVLSAEAVNRLFEKEHDFFSIQGLTQKVRKCYLYENTIHDESNVTLHTRIVFNKGYKFIKVKTALFSGTAVNAITFFNGSTIETNNVLGYVNAIPDGTYKTYIAEIPDNCDFIGITYNDSFPNYTIEVSGNAEMVSMSQNDNELLPHTKIVSVCVNYRANDGTPALTNISDFNTGTTLHTPIKYNVKAGDIITFDNPNNYLVAYWWYNSDNTVTQQWFPTTAQSSIRKVVPENAIAVSLGFRLTSGLTFLTYVPIDVVVEHSMDDMPTENSHKPISSGGVYDAIQTLEMELEGKLDKYVEEDITNTSDYVQNRYIRYSDGINTQSAASGLIKMFYFRAEGIKRVKCYLGWDAAIPAAIAFYTSTIFAPNANFPTGAESDGAGGYKDKYYNKSESIQAITGINWYDVDVPEGTTWIAIGNRGAVLESPQILVSKENTSIIPTCINEKIDKSLKLASTGYAINPFVDAPYYAHIAADNFYITDGDFRGDFSPEGYNIGRWTIASQSIKDIEISARLGFKFIEANCQHTSDGYTICIHGNSGTFGIEVKSTDESVITTTDLRSTAINSKTLDWINTYVRYNSYYANYQTKIPTLDEFCQACKRYNIGLFLGQATVNDVKLAMRYMGNNLIVYNGPSNIRNYFDGYVLRWTNDSMTPEQLLEEARSYGAPFICGLGTTLANNLYNDDTLSGLVDDLHKEGFLVCCTGNYDTEVRTRRYFEMGFDFSSSGHQVNPFESNYEVYELGNPKDETLPSGITSAGTYSGGVLTLSTDQTISCGSSNKIELGKGYLAIEYDGEITVDFGYRRQGGQHMERQNISSDGTKALIITDFFLWQTTQLVITATADTVVKSLVYKTSKC